MSPQIDEVGIKKKTYAAPKVAFSITLKMEKAGNPPT